MKSFVDRMQDFLNAIQEAECKRPESLKYLINLTYGQIVFSPRHDYFIQAKYLSKLPFGKKKFFVIPSQGYAVEGPAPLPVEFREHVRKVVDKHPELNEAYKDLLLPFEYK